MSSLQNEIMASYFLYDSGEDLELTRDAEGKVKLQSVPVPIEAEMALGADAYRDIYQISEAAGAPISEKEVAGTMAGIPPGAAIGTVTAIPDLAALVKGGYEAATAEEGQALDEFLKGFSSISGVIGSEKAFEIYDSLVDQLPVSEQVKTGMKQGAMVGEFTGAGGVGRALGGAAVTGAKKYAAGAPARVAARQADTGVTLGAGVDPTPMIDKAIVAGQNMMGRKAHPNRIATRLPTAVKSQEDPITQPLQIGLDESKADPVQFAHNVGIVQKYPNLTEAESMLPPEEGSEAFINHVKDNLLWIHDKVPAETRQRSKLWYDGARAITDRFSEQYNLPDSSVAGVIAALSPQMDWYKNVSLAERVIKTMAKPDVAATEEMIAFAKQVDPKTKKPKLAEKFQPIIDDMLGKTLNDLDTPLKKAIFIRLFDEVNNPRTYNVISPEGDLLDTVKRADGAESGVGWGSFIEITKAVEAIESGGDKAILTPLMGTQHKVRSFYNNILDPNGPSGDVTIDTHAVAAGLLKPLSGASTEVHHNFGSAPSKAQQGADWTGATKNSSVTGVQGNYGLYAEAYRRAAAERGILPREMQSITWEAARGLFTDVYKRQKKGGVPVNVKAVDDLWQKYRKGEMTIDEVRDAIEQHAGGINPPTWQE